MLLRAAYLICATSVFFCEITFGIEISESSYEKLNEKYKILKDVYKSNGTHYVKDTSHRNIHEKMWQKNFGEMNQNYGYLPQSSVNKSVILGKWKFKYFTPDEDISPNIYDSSEDILEPTLTYKTKRDSNQEESHQKSSESKRSSNRRCISTQGQAQRRCLRKIRKLTNTASNVGKLNSSLHLGNSEALLKNNGVVHNGKELVDSNFNTQRSSSFLPHIAENDAENHSQELLCSCYWQHQRCGCDCIGSLNYDNFKNLSAHFIPCPNFTFTISGGQHYALPPNLFSNLKLVSNFNFFITNATFEYLCDPTPMTSPFTDVKFVHSALIRLKNVRVRRGWNWTPFRKLKGANTAHIDIVIEDSLLRRLTSDFSYIGNGIVETIDVANSKLSMIGSSAFETFTNITYFRVPDNKINSIRRTEFPKMALKLEDIDLRNNLLTNLDEDLFSAMPSLKEISLAGNPLKVLSEKAFHEVIARVHLRGLSEFPLNCDCNLKWLKDSKLADKEMIQKNLEGATCKRPRYLRGVPFGYLSKEHLRCF